MTPLACMLCAYSNVLITVALNAAPTLPDGDRRFTDGPALYFHGFDVVACRSRVGLCTCNTARYCIRMRQRVLIGNSIAEHSCNNDFLSKRPPTNLSRVSGAQLRPY